MKISSYVAAKFLVRAIEQGAIFGKSMEEVEKFTDIRANAAAPGHDGPQVCKAVLLCIPRPSVCIRACRSTNKAHLTVVRSDLSPTSLEGASIIQSPSGGIDAMTLRFAVTLQWKCRNRVMPPMLRRAGGCRLVVNVQAAAEHC